MRVASDTSPLSALAILGRLDLLRAQFKCIRCPEAVWRELERLQHEPANRALDQARADGWLEVAGDLDENLVEVLCLHLDRGEAEALALAKRWPAELLLIDESAGRSSARALGIRVVGTLGVLLRAKADGSIKSMGLEMDRLVTEAGFFVSQRIRTQFLDAAGEL